MSTRVLKGMRVVPGADIWDVHAELMDVCRPKAVDLLRAEYARAVALLIDRHRLGSGTHPSAFPLGTLLSSEARQRELMERANLTMSFAPRDGHVYAWGVGVHPSWDGTLLQVPSLVDYRFWDHTDPDESVPADEWEERGRVWRSLLSTNATDGALRWQALDADTERLVSALRWQNVEAIVAALPSPHERARNLAAAEAAEQARTRGGTAAYKTAATTAREDPDVSVVAACALTPITAADLTRYPMGDS